ncbi:MAG: serine hydrolase [Sphingomonadales bacterium]|nr:MAG: serine hydrolase [Sphingomonadales bacterium]
MRRFIIAIAAVTLATPAFAQDVSRMDTVVRADADKGEFMGSVLVARDGKILFDKGYGSANLEWKIANDGDTKFRLGSVTKQFTAVAIMRLVEQGKVKLDAPVKTYLPDAPASWDTITVFNLLTHSSGIPNLTAFDDFQKTKMLPATLPSLIARFSGKPLDFAPGEKMRYSNSGYILLTQIVEQASGQPYIAFVGDNILKPLGMADTGYDSHAQILPRRASGYTPSAKGMINADYVDMTIPQGAGALYSTTHDLLKWEQGLFGGKLLKPESLKLLTTPFKDDYALGVTVGTKDGQTLISHGGAIEGFNTWLGYDPSSKLTVVVLGNLNGGAPTRLGQSLMTLARGGAVTLSNERKEVTLAPASLQAYVGTYDVSPSFGFVTRVEGGKLIVQATRQGPLELHAESADHFFFKEVDAQIVFTRDAAGKVDGAVLHQNGREMKAPKTK